MAALEASGSTCPINKITCLLGPFSRGLLGLMRIETMVLAAITIMALTISLGAHKLLNCLLCNRHIDCKIYNKP